MKRNMTVIVAAAVLVAGAAGFAAGSISQQDGVPALSEEHQWLETLSGEFAATMTGVLGKSTGTSRVETVHHGLWSLRHFESTVMGQPYSGMEILGYDPIKQKYVSVYADSMTPILLSSEGTYDPETKTLTMKGISTGMDGETGEMTNTMRVTEDGLVFEMTIEGAPITKIDYRRKSGE